MIRFIAAYAASHVAALAPGASPAPTEGRPRCADLNRPHGDCVGPANPEQMQHALLVAAAVTVGCLLVLVILRRRR